MSVVRFYSGPVKFTLGVDDRIDPPAPYKARDADETRHGNEPPLQKPNNMGMGLKRCVSVYLLELVRLLLQYKWGTIFRQEWLWRMEELAKRNGKGVWLGEIEKVTKRFSLFPRMVCRENPDYGRRD